MDSLPKLKILVVDDNRTNVHILQALLKKLGHLTVTAENGEQAVTRFEEENPDLVLLDIMMPIMDGFEAARRIKARCSDRWVPVVFLSALNKDENLVEGLEAGGDDYLTKPINFVVLEAKVRSMQRAIHLQRKVVGALQMVKTVSDNVLDAIVTINHEARIISCNQASERVFGWITEDLIGQNVNVLMPEPYHSEHDGYVRSYVMGGPPKVIGFEREVSARRKDGTVFDAELGITEVRIDDERLFVGVIRDITERKQVEARLKENAATLQRYYEQSEAENHLVLRLMDKQLHRPGLRDPSVHYWLAPAQDFSGDVVGAPRSPSGKLYAMLGDATGHGLAAAMSALPVLSLFYRYARMDRSIAELIGAMNIELCESMPLGRFVAAAVICIDELSHRIEVWVGGTPEALVLDQSGELLSRIPSSHLPLGIVSNEELGVEPLLLEWHEGGQLLLCSDGLLEAPCISGDAFGSASLESLFLGIPGASRLELLRQHFLEKIGNQPTPDDVSILLLDCITPQ